MFSFPSLFGMIWGVSCGICLRFATTSAGLVLSAAEKGDDQGVAALWIAIIYALLSLGVALILIIRIALRWQETQKLKQVLFGFAVGAAFAFVATLI